MDRSVNNSQPAGQATQAIPGEIVSGQPAGGPDNLVQKARDDADETETQDPLGAGIDAYERGETRDACPYGEGSDEATLWQAGWDRQAEAQI